MIQITTSGLTRDTDKEYGKLGEKDSFAILYNKAIYRFVYNLESKTDVARFLKDFKLMKFENCDYEETDGGENKSIEFFYEDDEETPVDVEGFVGDGLIENDSIDYDYDYLHSITMTGISDDVFVKCGSFKQFEGSSEGKTIIEILNKI
ncbi:hypothetical protein OAG30_02765 [Flavobacteriaceae bacterium]|nr:hypothetical protein [Flavobacteriaceae bacterium]